MVFPSFMDTRNRSLCQSLIVPSYGPSNHLPSSGYLEIIHSINPFWVEPLHSTYQGPSLRTHQIYKNYDQSLSMRTYLHLGGESVTRCKGKGGTIFNFWRHIVGDYCIVTWLMMSLPVLWCHFLLFVTSLPARESQILYKPFEFVYWLRTVLTWHLKASRLALHR